MLVEITDKFADDAAIKSAWNYLIDERVADKNGLVTAWSKLARMAIKSGTFAMRKKAIKEVNTVHDIPDKLFESVYFQTMLKAGMIKVSEANEVIDNKLPQEKFDEWWKEYPYRVVSGKKVRQGKPAAQKRFFVLIRDEKTFNELMDATQNYRHLCGGLPKDPERFLKDNFWKDYASESFAPSMQQAANKAREITAADLDKMIQD